MDERKAYVQAGSGGYGARVFIPYNQLPRAVSEQLDRKCKWGGSDKDTGKCHSWEVPDDMPGHKRLQEITHYLIGYGYTVEKVGVGNHTEVWA